MTVSVSSERVPLPGRALFCVEGPRLVTGTRCEGTFIELAAAPDFAIHRIPSAVLVERPSALGVEAVLIPGAAGSIADDCDGDTFIRSAEIVINGGPWAPIAAMYRTGPTSTSVQLAAQETRESDDTGPISGRLPISYDPRLPAARSAPNRRVMLPEENRDVASIAW